MLLLFLGIEKCNIRAVTSKSDTNLFAIRKSLKNSYKDKDTTSANKYLCIYSVEPTQELHIKLQKYTAPLTPHYFISGQHKQRCRPMSKLKIYLHKYLVEWMILYLIFLC